MATTLTPKELAQRFGTDARTVRKFLRSKDGMDARVGKGSRWEIEARTVKSLQKRFTGWNAAQIAAKAAKNDATDAPEVDEG